MMDEVQLSTNSDCSTVAQDIFIFEITRTSIFSSSFFPSNALLCQKLTDTWDQDIHGSCAHALSHAIPHTHTHHGARLESHALAHHYLLILSLAKERES